MKLITILIYLQERRCFKHKIKKVIVGDYGGSTMICPICPTHHVYWHSKYRSLIRDKVEAFINGIKN